MKITRLQTKLVQVPFDPPIDLGVMALRTSGLVLVFLETDQGIAGEGVVFSFNGQRLSVLDEMVRSFEPLLVGMPLEMSGSFTSRAWKDLRNFGRAGISVQALASVECAMWDLRAKFVDLNVAHMLGMCRTAVPVYHSSGLWISLSPDQLQRAAADHVSHGFRAMKMRLIGSIAKDVERVRLVRQAIGPEIALMADANQKLTASEAIRLGRLLEEFNLTWLEEPVSPYDHGGEAEVAAALDTPIASGESVYTSKGVLELLNCRSCDVLMPDLLRMGGPAEFLKAANLAEAFDTPVSSHLYSEMSLSLMSTIPNATFVEYMPWISPIYKEQIVLNEQGHATVPDRPGWGYAFDPKAVEKYSKA